MGTTSGSCLSTTGLVKDKQPCTTENAALLLRPSLRCNPQNWSFYSDRLNSTPSIALKKYKFNANFSVYGSVGTGHDDRTDTCPSERHVRLSICSQPWNTWTCNHRRSLAYNTPDVCRSSVERCNYRNLVTATSYVHSPRVWFVEE